MRDPKRIHRILQIIEMLWTMLPDLRLGQLLFNFGGYPDDAFYIEDDVLENNLLKSLDYSKKEAITRIRKVR